MISKINKREVGERFERMAEQFLLEQGLCLIQRNFLCKTGEIDLIMQDQPVLVFVEVRFRQSTDFGGSEASISVAKQRRLIRAAGYYLKTHYGNRPPMCRFDVVAICGDNTINWIKNAFYV